MSSPLKIRSATPDDARPMAALLNGIVAEGGKTAIDEWFDATKVNEWFIAGGHCLGCLVAQGPEGALLGFQAIERFHSEELPPTMADIGTFIAPEVRKTGVGRQLTDLTVKRAKAGDISALRAVIRKDNVDALAFYRSCGFIPPSEGAQWNLHENSIVLVRTTGTLRC